jgi:hypothetical protein
MAYQGRELAKRRLVDLSMMMPTAETRELLPPRTLARAPDSLSRRAWEAKGVDNAALTAQADESCPQPKVPHIARLSGSEPWRGSGLGTKKMTARAKGRPHGPLGCSASDGTISPPLRIGCSFWDRGPAGSENRAIHGSGYIRATRSARMLAVALHPCVSLHKPIVP